MQNWHIMVTLQAPRGADITDDAVEAMQSARPEFTSVSRLKGNRLEFMADVHSNSGGEMFAEACRRSAEVSTDVLGFPVELLHGEVMHHDQWMKQIDPTGKIQQWAEENSAPTEFFFYDVEVPVLDMQELAADGLGDLAMEWIEDDAGRSLLVLGNDKLIVQGYVEAESREAATRHAMAVANDLFRNQLGEQLALPPARVRDPQEHLVFLNDGLLPDYQLPHIPLHQVMELGAAAHMRAIEPTPTEARLYRSQLPTDDQ